MHELLFTQSRKTQIGLKNGKKRKRKKKSCATQRQRSVISTLTNDNSLRAGSINDETIEKDFHFANYPKLYIDDR